MTAKAQLANWMLPRLGVSRFVFDLGRTEARAIAVRAANRVSPFRRLALRRLRSERALLVNVGCGPATLDGFVNLDLYPYNGALTWDCRRSIPLANGSADGIRIEHFAEHLEPREELPALLADCFRALRPGGVLRVIVPDCERFVRAYCDPDGAEFRELAVPDPFPEDLPTRMDIVNHAFHQWHEHRWGYDFATLAARLRAAGFPRAVRSDYGQSIDPRLARDLAHHRPYSIYVEAAKPA